MSAQHATVVFTSDIDAYTYTLRESEEVISNTYEKLGIDEVRTLTEEAYRRPNAGFTNKCIFTKSNFVTVEAQQALLKILEEPPEHCRFLLVIPTGMTLLPTVLSRVVVEEYVATVDTVDFVVFLKETLAERLQAIEGALKSKNTVWQRNIKAGLIEYLRAESLVDAAQLSNLDFIARHLLTRGASNKFLLEHLALTLPLK
jgi:DNA polymerase III delta prime subunit